MSRVLFQIVPPIAVPEEPVFISGNLDFLGSWNPAHAFKLKWEPPFHTGLIEVPSGTRFEFKITRGSWESEAVDAWGNVPMNSAHEAWFDATLQSTVADWKDRYCGRLTRETLRSDLFAQQREIIVWLPQGYAIKPDFRFPVLYMSDGDFAFDPTACGGIDLAADEWVSSLSKQGVFPEAIVVGIRHPEGFSEDDISLRDHELSPELGGEAFSRFLACELVPYIDQHYRTIAAPHARVLAGIGLGALNAVRTALWHTNIFGKMVCLSTSFEDVSASLPERSQALQAIEESPVFKQKMRMYFDYGTHDIDECYEGYHTILHGLLSSKGLSHKHDYLIQRINGSGHKPLAWRERLGSGLRFVAG